MPVFYSRPARRYEQAHQAYLILIGWARYKKEGRLGKSRPGIITYGELAELMGYDPRTGVTLGPCLGILAHYCNASKLPLLNAIVVDLHDEIGEGAILNNADPSEDQRCALDFDWFAVRPPSLKALKDCA